MWFGKKQKIYCFSVFDH